MTDANLALLRAHRQNVDRYHHLLSGNLSDLERVDVERRIGEEGFAAGYGFRAWRSARRKQALRKSRSD